MTSLRRWFSRDVHDGRPEEILQRHEETRFKGAAETDTETTGKESLVHTFMYVCRDVCNLFHVYSVYYFEPTTSLRPPLADGDCYRLYVYCSTPDLRSSQCLYI